MSGRVRVPFYLVFAILCFCIHTATAAPSPFDPVQDDPALPRVLIIGDSISIGYTLPVRQNLQGKANVHRIPVNGQFSTFGLQKIKEWLGDEKWDVIHFNWGIWDTHLLDSEGRILAATDEGEKPGEIRTTIPQYKKNLSKIIDQMQSTGATLIWATTTPMTCRTGDRRNEIDRFNAAALSVMRERSVIINDLNAAITPHLTEKQASDGCHFTPEGSAFLGAQVAETVLAVLREPDPAWKLEQTEATTLHDRQVVRFEHDCIEEWGYTEVYRQYFYVVESKFETKGPLLVCLHSAGSAPDKFQIGTIEMPGNVKRVAEAGDDFTGLMVNSGVGSEWWWGGEAIKADPDKYKQALTSTEQRVLATIEWVVRKYDIDRNRIYLTGISMGGSGTLGIGMSQGNVFAALQAGVPASTLPVLHRLTNAESLYDVPPVLVFFSQTDPWAKGMEEWLAFLHGNKLFAVTAWGPWGHANHYEMTDPAAYEFPWLAIRKNRAYPAFTNTSSDDKYPGFRSDAEDQDGQMNAYFRWAVLEDERDEFAIELRLVHGGELANEVDIPSEVTSDVTLRRIQRFSVVAGEDYRWRIEQGGRLVDAGLIAADRQRLITIPKMRITAKPASLIIESTK
mgnify:CR=1 FL=1